MKERRIELFDLAEGIRKCTSCPLWKERTLAVPGEGPKNASIMVIGEAPGNEENRTGKPFVGKSGILLTKMLSEVGIEREKVFITGALKCHPSKNRNPSMKELNTCRELWLQKQIEIIKPKLIVLLGAFATKSLLKEKFSEVRGKKVSNYFITYHPAAAMRFPKIKEQMKKDLVKLANHLKTNK